MEPFRPTLAIYGIQDTASGSFPKLIHDHNLALFEQGRVLKYLHLERITRNKYDSSLPGHLYELLKSEGLAKPDEYDIVFADHFIGRSFISRQGNLRFEANRQDQLCMSLERGRAYWLGQQREGWVLNHELSHAYSVLPFVGQWHNNSLLFQFDGGASQGNYSIWHYNDNQLRLIKNGWELTYLSSLYNANALTFSLVGANIQDQNSVPGKFMGYASMGVYRPEILQWLKEHAFFANAWKQPKVILTAARKRFHRVPSVFDLHHPFIQDVAATLQRYFEDETLKFIEQAQSLCCAEHLYFSGGSALNIKLNRRIVASRLFQSVHVPPATNDSGLALGAGAALELAKGHSIQLHTPYLNNWGIGGYGNTPEYSRETLHEVARRLVNGEVLGICNGYGEVGPRALGNRSIVARPDSRKLAAKVSETHKQREWYRPIAPVMLSKYLSYFTAEAPVLELGRYMLTDYAVKPQRQSEIAGVVHSDGTARIQVLENRMSNPFLFDLLTYLDQEFQIKALINTSFNGKGEPIVHTYKQAEESARQMALDGVVLGGNFKSL
ncbi:MAG: carbamoyltransferase C-terminal domain-containing protein [Bacteroidales bacterium]